MFFLLFFFKYKVVRTQRYAYNKDINCFHKFSTLVTQDCEFITTIGFEIYCATYWEWERELQIISLWKSSAFIDAYEKARIPYFLRRLENVDEAEEKEPCGRRNVLLVNHNSAGIMIHEQNIHNRLQRNITDDVTHLCDGSTTGKWFLTRYARPSTR